MGDISNLTTGERTLEILHPGTHAPLGIRIKLLHVDDEKLERLKRAVTDESQRLASKGKFFKADDLHNNTERLMCTAITGWEWYNPTGGPSDKEYDPDAMPDFEGNTSPECNAKMINAITRKLPWFKDQVQEAIGDLEGFFVNSKTT